MKKATLLFILVFTASCISKKTQSQNVTTYRLESDCPKDGKCSIQVFENKSIEVKQDEFGSTYYNLEESLNTKVIKYIYSRTVKGNLQDAGYREEIVFEINNDNQDIILKNSEIQNTKMLFGRFCYCKGKTGNYKVNQGELSISTKNKTIDLNFKIIEVPQIINKIKISLN